MTSFPVPAVADPELAKRHAKNCPDCTRCGSRLHCSHQCGNYRIFGR
jgi:hypothetical protein